MTSGLIKFWSHTHAKETISTSNKKKTPHTGQRNSLACGVTRMPMSFVTFIILPSIAFYIFPSF